MQRSKSNEFNSEALLNAIRLAVREEIRETLSQGGFSFDDRRLDTEEASKVLQISPDWLYRNARKLPFTWRLGRGKPYAFPIEDPDVDSEGSQPLVFAKMVSRMRSTFTDSALHLRRKSLRQKIFRFVQRSGR